ncbi:MAG TPA: trypsin-like peptidase domain-containing protein [Thermoleophilaceae bacterium]|nr:trypsin-like peptidase domain-containing protein [Thermoleophilaceae bacterium]
MRTLAALASAAALLLAGCSGDDEEAGNSRAGAQKVETTRVQVVEGLGKEGGFDARELYRRLSPGVVTVLSLFEGSSNLLRNEDDGEGGQGSGFVLDANGYIATNAHVVTSGDPPNAKRAKQVFVEFSDGNRVPAEIIGDDPFADVALLKVDPKGLSLSPLALGRSESITVGEPVVAIGSPFGERQSLSVGVISAVDRTIQSLTQFQIGDAIQTDAAINPGNSGGPLLDSKGRVLGINAQIKSRSGGGEGVGFAIPVNAVRRSLGELREKGRVEYGFLGVTTLLLWPQLAERLDLRVSDGAVVQRVEQGSPADEAGLTSGERKIDFQGNEDIPAEADVIVAVDGNKLTRSNDLADVVSARGAGDTVELELLRDGKRRTVKVELDKRPLRR